MALTVSSFAKINRSLRILGKRDDGFHQIDTIMQTISLHDDLTFVQRPDDQLLIHCEDQSIPTDHSNLIVKAGLALLDHAASRFGADVYLEKRIPAQGGLGGGSSNAAVALLAFNDLWRLGVKTTTLMSLAARLGADVPFFLLGGTVRAQGIGTELSSLPDGPKSYVIIITPGAKVSTATAYESLKAPSLTSQRSVSILSSSFAEPISGDRAQWALHNDFEGVIFEIEPEIKRAKTALLDAGAQGSLLAGSGSSVFGIFENEDARERALTNLKSELGWQIFSGETISRAEYLGSLNSSLLRSLNFKTDTGA